MTDVLTAPKTADTEPYFEAIAFEESALRGMEIQACSLTKTVQVAAWDHGDPGATPSPALTLAQARHLHAWLGKAIAELDNA